MEIVISVSTLAIVMCLAGIGFGLRRIAEALEQSNREKWLYYADRLREK